MCKYGETFNASPKIGICCIYNNFAVFKIEMCDTLFTN